MVYVSRFYIRPIAQRAEPNCSVGGTNGRVLRDQEVLGPSLRKFPRINRPLFYARVVVFARIESLHPVVQRLPN